MAAHYGVGILPARPYHPKDKAKVGAGVRSAQFYLLGRLRNLKFFSLAECNAAITEILVQLNGRVMRRLGVSRRELFETIERPVRAPPHGGGVPPRSACCGKRPALWRPTAWHLARPHAERAPAVFRMEPRALPEPGSRDRSQHRGADHRRADPAATSGAGLPHLPRHPAPLSRH